MGMMKVKLMLSIKKYIHGRHTRVYMKTKERTIEEEQMVKYLSGSFSESSTFVLPALLALDILSL